MKMKRVLSILTAVALITGFYSLGNIYGDETSKDKLNEVNSQLNQTKQQLNEGKAVENKLNREISSLENQINQTQGEIDALRGNIEATQSRIQEALDQLAQVEADMAVQSSRLSARLRTMYKNGGVGAMDVLLGSNSISDFMTNMDMVQRIFESDKEVLAAMEKQHAIIEAQRQYLKNLQVQLETEKNEEAARQSELQQSRSAVSEKKSEVATNNKALQEQVNALNAEANRLIKEIQSLQSGGDYEGGIMSWPVQGRITSPFGYRTHPILKKKNSIPELILQPNPVLQ